MKNSNEVKNDEETERMRQAVIVVEKALRISYAKLGLRTRKTPLGRQSVYGYL